MVMFSPVWEFLLILFPFFSTDHFPNPNIPAIFGTNELSHHSK